MPRGSGIVFRHYATQGAKRTALFARIQKMAQRQGLMLVAGGQAQGIYATADGIHISLRRGKMPMRATYRNVTMSGHNLREIARANRLGANLIFLSPVFATRSHPDQRSLGPMRFATLARHAQMPVIALGGMNARRFQRIAASGCHGWASIDALTQAGGKQPVTRTRI